MRKRISGRELTNKNSWQPYQLVSHAINGHTPFNKAGRPIPPPDVQKNIELLDGLRKECVSRGWAGSLDELPSREAIKIKRYFDYKCGGNGYKSQFDKYYNNMLSLNDLRDHITFLEARIKSMGYSWEKYELPEDDDDALPVIDLLMDAFFEIDEIATMEARRISFDQE